MCKIFKNTICYLLLFGTSFSCSINELSTKEKMIYQIDSEVAFLLYNKYNVKLVLTGIRSDKENKIDTLKIGFKLNRILNKEEIRQMLFECSKIYLEAINHSPKLQPFLADTPFQYKNLQVDLYLSDAGKDLVYPNICYVTLIRSKVFYRTNNPENPRGPFFTEEEETLDEALRIINET